MKVTPGRQPGKDLSDGTRFAAPTITFMYTRGRGHNTNRSTPGFREVYKLQAGACKLRNKLHVTQRASTQAANRTIRIRTDFEPKPQAHMGEQCLKQNLVTNDRGNIPVDSQPKPAARSCTRSASNYNKKQHKKYASRLLD